MWRLPLWTWTCAVDSLTFQFTGASRRITLTSAKIINNHPLLSILSYWAVKGRNMHTFSHYIQLHQSSFLVSWWSRCSMLWLQFSDDNVRLDMFGHSWRKTVLCGPRYQVAFVQKAAALFCWCIKLIGIFRYCIWLLGQYHIREPEQRRAGFIIGHFKIRESEKDGLELTSSIWQIFDQPILILKR